MLYWCGAYMTNFPTDCSEMETGYRYFTILKDIESKTLTVSCNSGKPISYDIAHCKEILNDNIVWIKLKGDFGDDAVQYQPEDRRK